MQVKDSIAKGDIVLISGLDSAFDEFTNHENYAPFIGKEFEVVKVDNDFVHTKRKTVAGEELFPGTGTEPFEFHKKVWLFNLASDEEAMNVREEIKKIKVWDLLDKVLPHSRLTLLHGPPGTGKTTIANKFGNNGDMRIYNITLTEETPAAELRGHFIPKGHEFVWMDGPAMTAFRNGNRLVLNEIDKASGDALTFCHALLDDPGIARITLPTGETVEPHPDFQVIATMNGEPDDLPEALRDRFAVCVHVDQVHPDAVKALSKDLHKAAKKGTSNDQGRSISIRGWKTFDFLRETVGPAHAALAVFGGRAETLLNSIRIEAAKFDNKD